MAEFPLQDIGEKKRIPTKATIKGEIHNASQIKNPKIRGALTSNIAKTTLNYGTDYALKRLNR